MNTSEQNPYHAPQSPVAEPARSAGPAGWLSTVQRPWMTIGLSGVVFGIIGGPLGMFVGGAIAFPVSFFVTLLLFGMAAVIANAPPRGGLLYAVSTLAGLLSGALSMLILSSGRFHWTIAYPALIGAVGGLIGAVWEMNRQSTRFFRERRCRRNLTVEQGD